MLSAAKHPTQLCLILLEQSPELRKFPIQNPTAMIYGGYVYMMTNRWNTVLYTGVTSRLKLRVCKHKVHYYKYSFTARYNAEKLVWYEFHDRIEKAIAREKQIKGWTRKRKEALIHAMNPEWKDLYDEIAGMDAVH